MSSVSKKRRAVNETIEEANKRMADDLLIAQGNLQQLESQLEDAEAEHDKLLEDYGENSTLGVEVAKSQANIELLRKETSEAQTALDILENNDFDMDNDKTEMDDIKESLGIARDNLETCREEVRQRKETHNQLLGKYDNGKNPDFKADLDKAKAEYDNLRMEERSGVDEVNKLARKLKALKVDGRISGSQEGLSGQEGLFVPEGNTAPIITVTDTEDGLTQSIEEDDPEDLMSPKIARKIAGLGPDDIRMDGWRGKTKKLIIVGRGPPNASNFRMEPESKLGVAFTYNKDSDITLNRYGEMKNDNKDFLYGKFNDPVIQGVAWVVIDNVNPVDMLIPVPKGTKGAPRVTVAIKIKWTINDAAVKSWETRTTVRRLWGHAIGDLYIYDAAVLQEKRYNEYLNKTRPALDRSPTPGVVPALADGSNPSSAAPTSSASRNAGLDPGSKTLPIIIKQENAKSPMMKYKDTWCEMKGADPNNLSEEQEVAFIRSWDLMKT